jgi:energy-coupling factor transporter ATP-binding protein EcfA2
VVDHLTRRFGERTAFLDVSFDVAYGEVFGFLGPNGAGKTTTVRALGTLIAPTSGSATVAGIPLALICLAPLLAAWAISADMAASVVANEVPVAQQLGILAGFPAMAMILLLALGVIQSTLRFGLEFGAVVVAIDMAALRIVCRLFDRERLVTGARAGR